VSTSKRDVLARRLDVLQLVEERDPLLLGAVCRDERLRLVGLGVDAAGLRGSVEGAERTIVDRHEGGHGLLPRRHRRALGEAGDEAEEEFVGARRDIDRRGRAEDGAQAVLEHGGLGQWRRDARRQPAGIAPRGTRCHVLAVENRHVDALLCRNQAVERPTMPAPMMATFCGRAGVAGMETSGALRLGFQSSRTLIFQGLVPCI
jgi:hypothetical protein